MSSTSTGTTNMQPFWHLPQIPSIITVWASILPLVCHLASFRADYEATGRASLLGRLTVSVFPRLGDLASLSRLCIDGPEYLDEASVRGSSSRTVRDVQWGSVFPCANGASSAMVTAHALSRRKEATIKMPETATDTGNDSRPPMIETKHTGLSGTPGGHRRYQTLHVLRFNRKPLQKQRSAELKHFVSSLASYWAGVLFLCIHAVVLSLCGLYGTASAILLGAISQVVVHTVPVKRPSGYLENNEAHSACMLISTHRNANVWYLYIGDRGIVDSVLNKPMINIPPTRRGALTAFALKVVHMFQLLTMTYVAAQKGWDGVALALLVVVNWTSGLWRTNSALARNWLETEKISVETTSFEFTGRTIMLGAIQAFSGSQQTAWMDEIVAPHPRREAWLEKLGVDKSQPCPSFNEVDLKAIATTSGLAGALLTVMQNKLREKAQSLSV